MEGASESLRKKVIEETVIHILKDADLETATEYSIRTVAARRLGVDRFELVQKRLIRGVIESFLLSTTTTTTTTSEAKNNNDNDGNELQGFEAAHGDVALALPQVQQPNGGVDSVQNDNGKIICKLSEKRNVAVHDFKGQSMVSIRDYYEKDGKLCHSAKGISLTAKQWLSFKDNIPAIEEAITKMKSQIRLQAADKPSEPDMSSSVVDSAPQGNVATDSKQTEADLPNPKELILEGSNQTEVDINTSSTTPNPHHPTPADNVQLHIDTSTTPLSSFASRGHLQHDSITAFPPKGLMPIESTRLDGKNYYCWKHQMDFFLAQLGIAYVLTEPCPSICPTSEPRSEETVQAKAAIQKWVDDDYICRRNILSSLSDNLFNEYSRKSYSAKELWEELKYVYDEDFGTKRSQVNKYVQFQMVDGVPILDQVQELHNIANSIMASGIWMDEYFHVSVIISKLPPSWRDYRLRLMHDEFLPFHKLMHRLKVEEEARNARKRGNPSNNSHIVESRGEFGPRRRDTKRLCYSCKKEGHISKYCPDRRFEVCENGNAKDNGVVRITTEANMVEESTN